MSHTDVMTLLPDVLLIGAGDLGTEIGRRLSTAGHGVVAVRRHAELVDAPLAGVSGDVLHGLPLLPPFSGIAGGPKFLVVCLTAGGRQEDAYQAIFLSGVGRVLDDLVARGWQPERAIFVSSTGVCAQRGVVTEETPPDPQTATSRVLLAAEQQFLERLPTTTTGTVVRPSGIYGPGREWFITQVRQGKIRDPYRMTHRIHRDDAAAAITHLLTMKQSPERLYLLTDDEPVVADDVAAFIADVLGIEWTRAAAADVSSAPSRRISNDLLRDTGFEFGYPSYRQGYSQVLSG